MGSDAGVSFQHDPAWAIRNDAIANPARNVGMPDLLDDTRVTSRHGLIDRRVPVRAKDPGFGRLPPWAQPAWIRQ